MSTEIVKQGPDAPRLEVTFRPSMDMGLFKEGIRRLYTGFARPLPDAEVRLLWLERLSTSQITGPEWTECVNWFLDNGDRLPVLPVALQRAKTIRESHLVAKRQQERNEGLQAARLEGPGMSLAEQQYEQKRQAMKRQLGIGDYRQAEHIRRYGPELGTNAPRPEPGLVRLPDGSPDPEWPELPDREPAWRRKAVYDAGLWSLAQAQAPTLVAARKAAVTPEERGRAPRRMF